MPPRTPTTTNDIRITGWAKPSISGQFRYLLTGGSVKAGERPLVLALFGLLAILEIVKSGQDRHCY